MNTEWSSFKDFSRPFIPGLKEFSEKLKIQKHEKSFKATSSKSVVHAGRKIFGDCHLETGNNRIKLDRHYYRQTATGPEPD